LTQDVLERSDSAAKYTKIREMKVLESSEFLNYTWQAVKQSQFSINIKISFKHPLNVSSSDPIKDNLVLNITDPLRFRSQKLSYLKEKVMIKAIP
jgi:hypothetical protein